MAFDCNNNPGIRFLNIFYTCHDSTAYMTCEIQDWTLHPNLIEIREKYILVNQRYEKKFLVKCIPV